LDFENKANSLEKKGMENITYAIQSIKERYKTKFS
jgi:hypothetical protein